MVKVLSEPLHGETEMRSWKLKQSLRSESLLRKNRSELEDEF